MNKVICNLADKIYMTKVAIQKTLYCTICALIKASQNYKPHRRSKWAEMGVHKSGFFLKACSLNCLKMQSLRVFRSYMRWKKLGPDYPLKEFHDGKIRILARSDPRRRKIALPPLGNQKGFKSVKKNSI